MTTGQRTGKARATPAPRGRIDPCIVAMAQNAMQVFYNPRLKIMHMLWAIGVAFGALHCGSHTRDAKVGEGALPRRCEGYVPRLGWWCGQSAGSVGNEW